MKDCIDIDECRGDVSVCENGNCVNMGGTFACECHPGFELSPDGQQCVDINECAQEEDSDVGFDYMCLGGKCINRIGSYVCECPQGFTLSENGKGCIDTRTGDCYADTEVDENGNEYCTSIIGTSVLRAACCCSSVGNSWGNPCEKCPAEGSDELHSLCPSGIGFMPDVLTVVMEDIDECTELPGACQGGNCINSFGSYECTCPSGYELDDSNMICHDVNECADEVNLVHPENVSIKLAPTLANVPMVTFQRTRDENVKTTVSVFVTRNTKKIHSLEKVNVLDNCCSKQQDYLAPVMATLVKLGKTAKNVQLERKKKPIAKTLVIHVLPLTVFVKAVYVSLPLVITSNANVHSVFNTMLVCSFVMILTKVQIEVPTVHPTVCALTLTAHMTASVLMVSLTETVNALTSISVTKS